MKIDTRSLGYRLSVPVFGVIAVITISLVVLIQRISDDIHEDYQRFIISAAGSDVEKLLASAASEITSSTLLGNPVVAEAKKKSVTESVRLLWTRAHHDGVIFSNGEIVFSTLGEAQARQIQRLRKDGVYAVNADSGSYLCHSASFPLWGWTVTTVAGNSGNLLSRREVALLVPIVAAGSLLMAVGLFLVFRRVLQMPVSSLVSAAENATPVAPSGIAEFDTIGIAVNNAFERLNERTASLEEELASRKRLEEQLLQSQKMEAIGLLAGGIAHDFNNILMAVLGYAELLRQKLPAEGPLNSYAGQIASAATRGAELTKGLLAFSRKQIISPQPVDLNTIIRETEGILRRLIGEDIELKTNLIGRDLIVMADKGQIDQVLMNLATNARDAMPGGGMLILETGLFCADEAYAESRSIRPGTYATLSVSDTGVGMDAKTRQQIFEPFFTTKQVGKGTGLGLSVVYGIVSQHNASIFVYSEAGRGTTFRILFPLTGETAACMEEVRQTPAGGSETILLAEDDPDVRGMLGILLRSSGYRVIEAENGEEAVDRFRENRDEVDLVLLDVIMPRKNGKEALDEIRSIRPDVKSVFMSGYTDDIIHRGGMLEKDLDLIEKPVNSDNLLIRLRSILDR